MQTLETHIAKTTSQVFTDKDWKKFKMKKGLKAFFGSWYGTIFVALMFAIVVIVGQAHQRNKSDTHAAAQGLIPAATLSGK